MRHDGGLTRRAAATNPCSTYHTSTILGRIAEQSRQVWTHVVYSGQSAHTPTYTYTCASSRIKPSFGFAVASHIETLKRGNNRNKSRGGPFRAKRPGVARPSCLTSLRHRERIPTWAEENSLWLGGLRGERPRLSKSRNQASAMFDSSSPYPFVICQEPGMNDVCSTSTE